MGSALTRRRPLALVLLWHRVGPTGPQPHEVVPTVAVERFEAQLDVVCSLGRVVSLAQLDDGAAGGGLRFALTFDDDDAGHVRWTLPILESRGLPATFFLSGRWAGDAGPYWWTALETRIRRDGLAATAARFDRSNARTPGALAAEITGTRSVATLEAEARALGPSPLLCEEARRLVAAGHEIGFHTREHPSLPSLSDGDLERAVTDGREAMASDLDVAIDRFAYPHGHADDRTVEAVRAAGFRSGWTTTKRFVDRDDDPARRGRWDLAGSDPQALRGRLLRAAWRAPA